MACGCRFWILAAAVLVLFPVYLAVLAAMDAHNTHQNAPIRLNQHAEGQQGKVNW